MIAESRAMIADALVAAELRVVRYPSGKVAPPCVVIGAGTPWMAPAARGGAVAVSWRLTLLAGAYGAEAAWAVLDGFADTVFATVYSFGGVLVSPVSRPGTVTYGDVEYLGATIDLTHHL